MGVFITFHVFVKMRCLNKTQNSCLHLLSAEVISRLSHLPDNHMGSGDPNSSLHVCYIQQVLLICESRIQPETDFCSQPGLGWYRVALCAPFILGSSGYQGRHKTKDLLDFAWGNLAISGPDSQEC